MTQYAYPDAHVSVGDWSDHGGNLDNNLWQDVDDAFDAANSTADATYATIIDELGELEEFPVHWGMSDITDPNGAGGAGDYKIHIRWTTEYGGGAEDVVAKLYKDTSTLFATSAALSPPMYEGSSDFVDSGWELTQSQITAGGTFQNLTIKLGYFDTNGDGGTLWVSKVYFECPDAAASAATTNPSFLLFVDP